MKANELMIGDWVRRCWTCTDTGREIVRDFQVTEIRKNGDTLYAWGKGGNMGRVEELEPIPLTAEILEKNGFTMNTKAKSKKAWQISNNELYVSWWNGRLNTYYKPEVTKSMNHINTDCVYVHQLQHALRLCGIEKEIEL